MRPAEPRRDAVPSSNGARRRFASNPTVWRASVVIACLLFVGVLMYRYNFDASINVLRTAQAAHSESVSTLASSGATSSVVHRLSTLKVSPNTSQSAVEVGSTAAPAPIASPSTSLAPSKPEAPVPAPGSAPQLPSRYPRVIVSLTTIPDRIWYLNDTLVSISRQTRIPDEIVIAVPYTSRRFRNETNTREQMRYDIPDFISNFKVTMLRCHDSGPGTKFVPIIHREMAEGRWDSIVVIADDDVIYPPDWLETYLRAYEDPKLHGSALGMRGYCVLPYQVWDWPVVSQMVLHGGSLNVSTQVDVLTANHGILVRPYLFRKYNITIPEDAPESAFYMDDIWINGVLARNGVTKYVVPIAQDPKHRPNVQKKTVSLERVPNGRPFHNTYLMHYFGKYWTYCPQTRAKDLPSYVYESPRFDPNDRTAHDDDALVKEIRRIERDRAEREAKKRADRDAAHRHGQGGRDKSGGSEGDRRDESKETLFEKYRRLKQEADAIDEARKQHEANADVDAAAMADSVIKDAEDAALAIGSPVLEFADTHAHADPGPSVAGATPHEPQASAGDKAGAEGTKGDAHKVNGQAPANELKAQLEAVLRAEQSTRASESAETPRSPAAAGSPAHVVKPVDPEATADAATEHGLSEAELIGLTGSADSIAEAALGSLEMVATAASYADPSGAEILGEEAHSGPHEQLGGHPEAANQPAAPTKS